MRQSKWYDRFGERFPKFGIPNLALYIGISTAIIFFFEYVLRLPVKSLIAFDRDLIMQGQIWRIITFIFTPGTSSFFWILFSILAFYSIGKELEDFLGTSIFTLYYLTGFICTVIAGFITGYATSSYINLSLFLAYATLYPNSTFTIYLLIPIKAKYLAIFNLVIYGFSLIQGLYYGFVYGQWYNLILILASLVNFFLFFWSDILFVIQGFLSGVKRKMENRKRKKEFERDLRKGGK